MPPKPFVDDCHGVSAQLTGKGRFQTALHLHGQTILSDEPVEVGGLASGPTPYELLSGSLAACTAMTMRLYAERKGWELPPFRVEVVHSPPLAASGRDRFVRRIHVAGPIDEERKAKLLEIANRCPVHRTLERGFDISTAVGDQPASGEPPGQHMIDMEAVCA
jgi:putative redox protein